MAWWGWGVAHAWWTPMCDVITEREMFRRSTSSFRRWHSTAEWLKLDRNHVIHPYTSFKNPALCYFVSSAKGPFLNLVDSHNKDIQVLDGMSSWWAAIHGYRVAELDDALKNQASLPLVFVASNPVRTCLVSFHSWAWQIWSNAPRCRQYGVLARMILMD